VISARSSGTFFVNQKQDKAASALLFFEKDLVRCFCPNNGQGRNLPCELKKASQNGKMIQETVLLYRFQKKFELFFVSSGKKGKRRYVTIPDAVI